MKTKMLTGLLAFSFLLFLGGLANGSQCVNCHTDSEKLKEVARSIPQKVASTETAGKG